jgi:hypothetical protein
MAFSFVMRRCLNARHAARTLLASPPRAAVRSLRASFYQRQAAYNGGMLFCAQQAMAAWRRLKAESNNG